MRWNNCWRNICVWHVGFTSVKTSLKYINKHSQCDSWYYFSVNVLKLNIWWEYLCGTVLKTYWRNQLLHSYISKIIQLCWNFKLNSWDHQSKITWVWNSRENGNLPAMLFYKLSISMPISLDNLNICFNIVMFGRVN